MKNLTAWLLNCVYLILYAFMSPVILYRRLFRGRSLGHFGERFLGLAPVSSPSSPSVWLHAVSVGEVNLLESLLNQLKQEHPDFEFVISTTTATGMRLAKRKYPDHKTFFFPIDFSWAVKNALRRLRPQAVVLTELEVWPNLIRIANTSEVPVVVINGRLSDKSFQGYQKWLRWVQPVFAGIDRVIAQTDEYASRFVQLGCHENCVSVAGSVKFDGATTTPDPALVDELGRSIGLTDRDVLFVAGSTQEPEELLAAETWTELSRTFPQLRLVIVPRHPERGPRIRQQLADRGIHAVLRSRQSPGEAVQRQQVLVSDTIGELAAWWSLSSIAFVGGSFGNRGGQNMIEPAASGAAVCFGPNTWNFKQIVQAMCAADVATQLQDESSLPEFVEYCLNTPAFLETRGKQAREFVLQSQGAVNVTCVMLQDYFQLEKDTNPPTDCVYRAA